MRERETMREEGRRKGERKREREGQKRRGNEGGRGSESEREEGRERAQHVGGGGGAWMFTVVLMWGREEVVFPLPVQILLPAASGSPRLCVKSDHAGEGHGGVAVHITHRAPTSNTKAHRSTSSSGRRTSAHQTHIKPHINAPAVWS
jgi:hypothetical protein